MFQVFTPSFVQKTHSSLGSTTQKMKFSIKDFVSKCDQTSSFLRIWSGLLKKSLMKNFIFCTVSLSKNTNSMVLNDFETQLTLTILMGLNFTGIKIHGLPLLQNLLILRMAYFQIFCIFRV